MPDFTKLCERIIDANGNPSVKDVLNCGFTMEHFLRMSQPGISAERPLQGARKALLDREIHYKD